MTTFKYLIRLTPIDTYFFGGEVSFGDNKKQNYFVRSNRMPQVSTLIGVLRYEVLRQKDLLSPLKPGKHFDDVRDAIGEKSFDMDPENSCYGIIRRISPVFIENNIEKKYYTALPLDEGVKISKTDIKCSVSYDCKCEYVMKAEGYDAKTYNNYLYWTDNGGHKVCEDDIFYEKEQVGITKNGKNADDKDAFYKMKTVGLRKGYNFVLSLTTSEMIEESETIVYMGGNRSAFKMHISRLGSDDNKLLGESFTSYFASLHKEGRYLLLGDAFYEDDELDSFPFFWAQSVCNRYIVTRHDEGVKWSLPKKTEQMYRLLGRGGVIYSETIPDGKDYLTNVGLNIII